MQLGLTVSILLHLAVLLWAFVSLQSPEPFRVPEPEPVEVALVTPEDLVRLKRGDRDAKQLEAQQADSQKDRPKKEQAKPKLEPAAPPAPPPPPPEEMTKPEPAKDPIAEKIAALPPEPKGPSLEEMKLKEAEEAARKAEEERKAAEKQRAEDEKKRAEAKRKAEEAKKLAEQKRLAEQRRKAAEAKKKQFDADRIAALLNKVPDRGAPPAGAPEPPVTPTMARGPVAGAPEGRDTRLSASQRSLVGAMMKRAVSRCWNINSGLDGIDRIVVEVEVRLRPDGRLQQPPRVVNSGPGPLFADAANSAIRALVQCEPYDLPEQFYEGGWDHMVVTFDPQRMF